MRAEEEEIVAVEAADEPLVVRRDAVRTVERSPSASALAAAHLQKTYAKRRVVDDVSLFVEPGEVVGLLGANGAGKTTTFYMMVGLETAERGTIRLGDREITKLPMYLRARLGLGYLPQEPSVFRRMTAAQNILAVLETLGLRRRERYKRLEERYRSAPTLPRRKFSNVANSRRAIHLRIGYNLP